MPQDDEIEITRALDGYQPRIHLSPSQVNFLAETFGDQVWPAYSNSVFQTIINRSINQMMASKLMLEFRHTSPVEASEQSTPTPAASENPLDLRPYDGVPPQA